MSEADRIRVLVVASEEHIRVLLADHLCGVCGYFVDTAMDHEEAVRTVQQAEGTYDFVLIDQGLPPDDGLETMKAIKALCPGVEIALLTNESDRESAVRAMREGAYGYIPKPLNMDEVAIFIESAAEHRQLRKVLETTSRERELLHGVLNVSNAVQSTLEPDEVLETILSGVRQLGYDRVRLYLLSEEGKELKGKMQFGGRQSDFEGLTLPLEGEEADVYSLETLAGKKPRLYKAGELGPDRWTARLDKQGLSEWVELPLLAKGKPIGKITIDNKESRRKIEESELGPLMLYANQAAMAIENAKLFSETQRQMRELTLLTELGQTMTSVLDLEQILTMAMRDATRVLGVEAASIWLLNEATDELICQAAAGGGADKIKGMRLPSDQGIASWVVRQGQPLLVPEVRADSRWCSAIDEAINFTTRSILSAPLEVRNKVIGVIQALNKEGEFTPDDVRLLSSLAISAAIAIDNARLFESTQNKMRQLDHLRQVGQALTGAITDKSKDVLDTIAQGACEVIGADCAVIYPYYADSKAYDTENIVAHGLRTELTRKEKPRIFGQSVTGRVMEQRLRVISDIVKEDPSLQEHRFIRREGIRAFLAVRLDVGGEAVGALFVNFRAPHQFTDDEQDTIQIFADQAAMAIKKARLFEAEARRRQEAETLRETALALTTTLEQREIFKRVLTELQKVVPYDSASVQLLKGDRLEIVGGHGFPNLPEILGISFPVEGNNPNREVVRRRASFSVQDAQAEYMDFCREPHVQADIHGWLGVPILIGDQLIGIIALHKHQLDFYTEEHARLAETLAAQAALAIENARLFFELREAKEWRDALIENAFDAVIAINQDKKITVFNQRAEEMLGWTAREMIGQSVARLHVDLNKARQIHAAVNREGTIPAWDIVLKHKDGTAIPALLSVNLIWDSQGRPIGQAGFIRDLREVKLLEDRLRALIRVNQAITSTLDLDEVLDLVVESAVAAFPTAEKGSIHLYNEKTGMLHIRASLGYSPEVIEALTLKVGEGRAGWVYERATPLVVGNAQEDERSRKVDRKVKHPEVQEQKSAICVPLAIKDRVIGTLSLDNITIFDAFKPEDLRLLSIFANQAAVAIMNAELMTKNRERLGKLEMLSRASNEMMSNLHSLSFDDRLNLIVRHAAQILDAEAGSILLVKRPGFLTKEACYGHLESDFQKGREFAIRSGRKTGLTGHIAYTGELFNARGDDLVGHWAVAGKEPAHVASGKCYSLLAIPLKRRTDSGEQLIGLLEVENKKDKDGQPKEHIGFTKEDEWILSIFAKTVVICLENAELYERTSDRLEEKVVSLKAIQETSAAISAELDLDELLDSITEKAAKVFAAPAASLMLWDNGEENLVVRAKYGLTDEYTQQRVTREKVDAVIALMDGLRRPAIVDLRSTPFGRRELDEAEHLYSMLSTPLVASDRLIGALNIYSKDEPRQFTADEIEVAEVFASQAAVAIRNAQLYEETTRRANALQALYEASQAVTGTLTRDELLNHIVEQAWRLAEPRGEKTHFSHLALVNGNRIRFAAAYPSEALTRLRDRIHEIDLERDARIGITGRAAVIRQSQLVGNVFQDPDYIDIDSHVHSQLSVPIQMGEQVIGIISVEHPDSNAFDAEDQRVLESLAAQAAVAIENARLYGREQRRAREAEAMVQVGQAISSTLDLNRILETVSKNALLLLGLEDGTSTIILMDEKTGDLVRSARVPPRQDGSGPRQRGGLTSLVIETGEPIVIPDVRRDSRVKASVVEEGVQSVIGVPLKVKEKTIGVLFANTFCPRDFTQRDIEMLSSLANQAAVAIENAKQYQELRQAHEDLAAATTMAWLGISGAEWSHAVSQKTSAIRYNVNTLRDLIHSPDKISQEILDDIERVAQEVQNIPMKGPMPAQTCEPVSPIVVDEVLREWLPRWCETRSDVELDLQLCCGNEFAHIDDSWLAIALEKLVSNALKAMSGGGRLTIASRVINHDRLEIIVEDTGVGIPEKALVYFLRERVPPEARQEGTGSGMGALIARFTLRSYGGDLELLRTGEGEGTALRVLLPVARKSP